MDLLQPVHRHANLVRIEMPAVTVEQNKHAWMPSLCPRLDLSGRFSDLLSHPSTGRAARYVAVAALRKEPVGLTFLLVSSDFLYFGYDRMPLNGEDIVGRLAVCLGRAQAWNGGSGVKS